MTGHQLAVAFAARAMAKRERTHRARDADVKKPPFLIERAFHFRTRVGQQSFLQADNPDVRKLESLATVHRDERDSVAAHFLLLLLALAVQRKLLEERLQS